MSMVIEYTDQYESAWNDYVTRSDSATIAHQIGWHKIMSRGLGHCPKYLLSLSDDGIDGILPLFLVKTWWGKRYLVSLPWIDFGGICADNQSVTRALLDSASDLAVAEKAEFVELRSINSDNLNLLERTDKVTFRLGLESDPDKLWKGFDAKLRNQIRKAEKSGLTTEFKDHSGIDEFYKVFSCNMRDLGTPVWGKVFFKQIFEHFPDHTQLLLVRQNKRVIAGGLVLAFKDSLYVPSASAYRNCLNVCPNHALYWAVIKYGCEHGYRMFDFGRSSHGSKTFQFKKQWEPNPTQLTWQYYLHRATDMPQINPDNPKYRLMVNLWRKLPLPLANLIGPQVIRNFP
jgi:serine/alanine adding enzyme